MTRQDLIAVQLMEELAEIQMAVSKALRFGFDNHHPEESVTNAQHIGREWVEACVMMEMLVRETGVEKFDFSPDESVSETKRERVEAWLDYSKKIGIGQ